MSTRKLVEYEIQMEALEFRSVNNVSQGIVKFVFRRNMEFHVTNTFLQTFLLTCVGYFSYYFDVDNFSDRIMVVLTTMLVVATITTSIQDVRFSIIPILIMENFFCAYVSRSLIKLNASYVCNEFMTV